MTAQAMSRGQSYLAATRLPFSSASVLPAILGAVWAWANGTDFHLTASVVAVLGVLFLHLGANTLNDYFDWDATDRVNRFVTPFSGGSRSRLEHLLGRNAFLHLSVACFLLAGGAALVLVLGLDRPLVLAVGAAGGLCGALYSMRPFSLQSRGLGELTILLAFGPLITLGMGYAACGVLTAEFFAVGIPCGVVVAAILWINEFPDVEADGQTGKRNLVVRLGTGRAVYGYVVLMVLLFGSVVALVAGGLYPVWALASLLTLPLAVKNAVHARRHHARPDAMVPAQAGTIQLQIAITLLLIGAIVAGRYF